MESGEKGADFLSKALKSFEEIEEEGHSDHDDHAQGHVQGQGLPLLSLEQVKSPFESEAEAAILQALEQNQKERRGSVSVAANGTAGNGSVTFTGLEDSSRHSHSSCSPGGNHILAGVPRNSVHLFHGLGGDTSNTLDTISQPMQQSKQSKHRRIQSNGSTHSHHSHGSYGSSRNTRPLLPPLLPPITMTPSTARPSLDDIASRFKMMESMRTMEMDQVQSYTQTPPPPPGPPTASRSKLSFNDAAKKIKMMSMVASRVGVHGGAGLGLDESAEIGPSQALVEHEQDPESLLLHDNDVISGEYEHEGNGETSPCPTSSNSDGNGSNICKDKEGRRKVGTISGTGLYQTYCIPCRAFTNFIYAHKKDIHYAFSVLAYIIVPLLLLATILFYVPTFNNPMGPLGATYSWWLLFVARQVVTFLLAQFTQFVLIDFIVLETRLAVLALGRVLTLMAMQAKGWPIVSVFWSVWNFLLLYGSKPMKWHWLYWQKDINLFNEMNPSGDVVMSEGYTRFLIALIIVGVIVMVKRVIVALILGKKKYVTYSTEMTNLMRKVLLISEVALLSKDIAANPPSPISTKGIIKTTMKKPNTRSHSPASTWLFDYYSTCGKGKGNVPGDVENEDDDDADENEDDDDDISTRERGNSDLYEIDEPEQQEEVMTEEEANANANSNSTEMKEGEGGERKKRRRLKLMSLVHKPAAHSSEKNIFSDEEKLQVESLLGEWEEVEFKKKTSWNDTSIIEVLQFRETLNYVGGIYPLSFPFGRAETRKECMNSAQNVYKHLLMQTPDSNILHFNTIMMLALDQNGKLQKKKARSLIRLLRPDREGNLTLLDFVKSCDSLYKRLKTFQISVAKAAQLDDAFEHLGNIFFYFFLTIIVLATVGVNPTQLFLSLTSVLLPLSFMFSSSASKYFEGILLVVARQPYDIGDRIAVSNPLNDTDPGGSMSWFVENITLYTTTVRLAASNEVATYSNGSLAHLRIINAKRSPKAFVSIKLKFGIEIPYQKVKIFGDVVESFVKDRPREWLKLAAFRATAVQADLGYIEYVVVLQHMESWQDVGDVLQSKADVASFCLEVSKKMGMRFVAPPMPVDLSMVNDEPNAMRTIREVETSSVDTEELEDIQEGTPKPLQSVATAFDTRRLDKIQSLFKTLDVPSVKKKS